MIATYESHTTTRREIANNIATRSQSEQLLCSFGNRAALSNTLHDFLAFLLRCVFPSFGHKRYCGRILFFGLPSRPPSCASGRPHQLRSLFRRYIFPAFLAGIHTSFSDGALFRSQTAILTKKTHSRRMNSRAKSNTTYVHDASGEHHE